MKKMNRRSFLQVGIQATAGVGLIASPLLIPRNVLAQADGTVGANDRVNVGLIGLGGRCGWLQQYTFPQIRDANFVAACDLLQSRLKSFHSKDEMTGKMKSYTDFRKMIETEKLDGVMVETTTHARAWVTVSAMQMGAHVYIEKPMALTVEEGRQMVNAARKYNRVTQVGTQQRSIPLNRWASELIRNGAIGKVKYVLAPNFVGPLVWQDQPGVEMPEGESENWWDVWTNQAPFRPYRPELHFAWSQWEDYDAGGLGFGVSGWGTHSYDQINCALGTDETGPVAVMLEEPCTEQDSGKYQNRTIGDDETGASYYKMAQIRGPRAKVKMLFANGTELRLHLDSDKGPGLGAIFVGEKGKIEINRDKISANPRELIESPDNPGPNPRDESIDHVEDWLQCIRTGEKCRADIEYGQRSTTLCELVNIARAVGKVGETLQWDPAAERFTNCDEGNARLARPRRKGYELPS